MENMQNLAKRFYNKWDQYKYRFVPWIARNLKKRSMRSVDSGHKDKLITDELVLKSLHLLHSSLHATDEELFLNKDRYHVPTSQEQIHRHEINLRQMNQLLGFQIERTASHVVKGQQGVIVTKGSVPPGALVSCYPGAIYYPQEPILFQSLGNPFIFKCLDGILIDGNNKGLSQYIYRSCRQRDRLGYMFNCDDSWLTTYPTNPLAIGQFVNNHNKDFPANVAYQELDLSEEFSYHLRQYIPNVFYSSSSSTSYERLVRMVVLISTREINEGEELLSSYFTIVQS